MIKYIYISVPDGEVKQEHAYVIPHMAVSTVETNICGIWDGKLQSQNTLYKKIQESHFCR